MEIKQFVEMLSIDETGHYPFSLYVEKQTGEQAMAALALNDVRLVYNQVNQFLMESPKRIYFSIDFPANRDIKTDFVAVFFKEGKTDWQSVIIPYDEKGNRLQQITSGEMFEFLLAQCKVNCHAFISVRTSAKN